MQQPDPIITPASWTQRLSLESLFPDPSPRRPLAVDLGCGKGRHLMAMAHKHSHMNFLGVERMTSRIQKLSRKLVRAELTHVRLLQVEISYAIRHLLPPRSVARCTIFFPDPWPKRRHHRRRLFCPAFVDDLAQVLAPQAHLHTATDDLDYFAAITTLFEADARFRSIDTYLPAPDEQTEFEQIFTGQGKPVGRLSVERL